MTALLAYSCHILKLNTLKFIKSQKYTFFLYFYKQKQKFRNKNAFFHYITVNNGFLGLQFDEILKKISRAVNCPS